MLPLVGHIMQLLLHLQVLSELDPTGAQGTVSAEAWATFFAALPDDARCVVQ